MPIPFNEWIPSRGTSGEYGYVNTKTGQFRTTLPNSKEEKTQNVEKSKKAALVTHSARQAKFNRTQAKRRNHSDETVKKINNIPIISINKDGTFTNNYVKQMATSESSTKVYTPVEEFILANTALNPIFKLAGRGIEYGFAKYGTQQMKNWGRNRIFNRELNKNINKTNLTIPSINYTTLNYNPITKQQSNIATLIPKNNYTENLIKLLGKGKDNKNLGRTKIVNNLSSHLQGDDAVKMFKQYGGIKIPEGSINGEQLRMYVPEARERYGLIGNTNITDEEIAESLYKHSKELGGNSEAVNIQGEPQLLFRGDTKRYTELKPRPLFQENAGKDNSLGTLFLDGIDFRDDMGVFRYLYKGFPEDSRIGQRFGYRVARIPMEGSFNPQEITGTLQYQEYSPFGIIRKDIPSDILSYKQPGNSAQFKINSKYINNGSNDINAFVVRTPNVRNSTNEIAIMPSESIPDEQLLSPKVYNKDASRMANHYAGIVEDAESKQQGLIKSLPNKYRADEHSNYTYFALPNFNIRNAKHILPYDLRIPRNWNDPNIYKTLIPITIGYELNK